MVYNCSICKVFWNPESLTSFNRSSAKTSLCMCFSKGYTLEQENKITLRDNINFLKEKDICFGCLCIGHIGKVCNKPLTCKVCSQNHYRVLRINQREREQSTQTQISQRNHWWAMHLSLCEHVVVQGPRTATEFYPSYQWDKVVQTYAFRDLGSTATFCSFWWYMVFTLMLYQLC